MYRSAPLHSVIGWWARTCALADLWEMPSSRDANITPREKSSLAGAGNRLVNTQMPGPRPCDQTQEQAEVDGEASSPDSPGLLSPVSQCTKLPASSPSLGKERMRLPPLLLRPADQREVQRACPVRSLEFAPKPFSIGDRGQTWWLVPEPASSQLPLQSCPIRQLNYRPTLLMD